MTQPPQQLRMDRFDDPRPCDRLSHLSQDLDIEILSYLNLIESNYLAHCNRQWYQSSRIERRRLVELTHELVVRLTGTHYPPSTFLQRVMNSPLARLLTHLPNDERFNFNTHEAVSTAVLHFPNLQQMAVRLEPSKWYTSSGGVIAIDHQAAPLTQPLQLPCRLTNFSLQYFASHNVDRPITTQQLQIYLDSLSTASQLHTIFLSEITPDLNLTVLTQLPLLTDLTLNCWPTTPIPDHLLSIVSSLDQLVSLRLGWTILPRQWSQLHLPHLQHISLAGGVNCSTDLVSLADTIMVKSIRHLRLDLDADAHLTKLSELVKFSQLEKLEICNQYLTEKGIRHIHAALIQLKTLTSLKLNDIYSVTRNSSKMNISEILAATPHLTSLELKGVLSTNDSRYIPIYDFSFLHTPLVHQRLVELYLTGTFTRAAILGPDGLLHCHHLRRLQLCTLAPQANEWWDELKRQLDSRHILPALESLDILIDDVDGRDEEIDWLRWDRLTGSNIPQYSSFRMNQTANSIMDG